MKYLIALARESGMPYQMAKSELIESLGLTPPISPLATLPASPRMPVRVLRLIAAGRGVRGSYSMTKPKLFELLGLPKQESMAHPYA